MAAAIDPNTMALVPAPPGYVVDFANPQRRGVPACYWVTGVGLILSTAFFAMRTFTKVRIMRDFKTEDWCVVGAYIFSVSVQGLLIRTFLSNLIKWTIADRHRIMGLKGWCSPHLGGVNQPVQLLPDC